MSKDALVKLKATITIHYRADPQHYGQDKSPDKMAALDAMVLDEDPANFVEMMFDREDQGTTIVTKVEVETL